MRRLLPVLIFLVVVTAPAWGGGLDSGGGLRGNGQVTAHDALGVALAGSGQATGIRATAGTLFGPDFPTPVMLTALQIGVVADGVALAWEGNDDLGIVWFRLERADAEPGAVDVLYRELGLPFAGPGPHGYLDRDVVGGQTYRYRLRARVRTGEEEVLGPWTVTAAGQANPARIAILPANPNPFRDSFSLSFTLPEPTPVSWRLLDVRGALVESGDLGPRPAGSHTAAMRPPAGLPRGIYFLEVRAGSVREVQKVVKLQ
jgi:hypothetical protein